MPALGGGSISTVAGGNGSGYSGDGSHATNAQLNSPADIHVIDTTRNYIYVADTGNSAIRVFQLDGLSIDENIYTIGGNGSTGYAGDDGIMTDAVFASPYGVFADGSTRIYVADTGNHAIRRFSTP